MMAALATTAWFVARPASPLRLLGLAVAALVIVDPLLVWSVGFWLSVGATFGIAVLAEPIATRLPGPPVLAAAVGVALAAQIGVAPMQMLVFGAPSIAALPANLLAVPAGRSWCGGSRVVSSPVSSLQPFAASCSYPHARCAGWRGGRPRRCRGATHAAVVVPLAAVVVLAGWRRARR
jgi:competence protein ComEC